MRLYFSSLASNTRVGLFLHFAFICFCFCFLFASCSFSFARLAFKNPKTKNRISFALFFLFALGFCLHSYLYFIGVDLHRTTRNAILRKRSVQIHDREDMSYDSRLLHLNYLE